MRRILPPWALLLLAAIAFFAGLLWLSTRPPHTEAENDPLIIAATRVEEALGLQLEPQGAPGGGLPVIGVREGSPAAQVGFQAGDRIVACGAQSIWHAHQFAEVLNQTLGYGRPAVLLVERDGDYRQVVFGPPGHPSHMPPAAAAP